MSQNKPQITLDSISLRGAGTVQITQRRIGHRFTLDSILLADFCRIKTRDKILESGAGSGVISILLGKKFPQTSITAVELQSAEARLAAGNISDNRLEGRITLITQDIRKLKNELAPGSFDVIVANPPFTKTGAGRKSPVHERQAARHDRYGDINAWLDLGVFLRNRGRYFLIFASDRLSELVFLLRKRNLEPKRMRLVHPHKDKPASLVLIEAVRSAGTGLEVLPPLIVHEQGGGYSEEVREIYAL